MLNFRDKDSRTANIVSLVAILLLVLMLVYAFVPKPKPGTSLGRLNQTVRDTNNSTQEAKVRSDEAKATIEKRSWSEGPEKVAPLALTKVNQYVRETGVRLLAFRPQRSLPGKDLQPVPFLVSVEGTYPKIMAFCQKLDFQEPRLAVNLIQVASADSSSDKVSASIGLTAYAKVPDPPATPSPLTTSSSTKSGSAPSVPTTDTTKPKDVTKNG